MGKHILFICPHWHQTGNVGVLRAKRFVRWLHAGDYSVTILAAGDATREEAADFGSILTVKDPLGLYTEPKRCGHPDTLTDSAPSTRAPNAWRRALAYMIFTPDLQVAWAYRCLFTTEVRKAAEDADMMISSSPPDSAHVLADWLAKRSGTPFIMDMRDGWLDEPMKPLLISSGMQRWREKRLESRCLQNASLVFVTSTKWKSMLTRRYPKLGGNIRVLTNAYPRDSEAITVKKASIPRSADPMRWVHAGRIQSSRPERNADSLLQPIFDYLGGTQCRPLHVVLTGTLEQDEESTLQNWKHRFKQRGAEVIREPQIPHEEMSTYLRNADVLLLLSASHASIPAKFFDYLASGRPMICIAAEQSIVNELASTLPQCVVLDLHNPDILRLRTFLEQCMGDGVEVLIPSAFSEDELGKDFLHHLKSVIA